MQDDDFNHLDQDIRQHTLFCEHVIEAINRLIAIDKTSGVFSSQTIAMPAPAEISFGKTGASEKSRLQFHLGHHESLGMARELGCHYAYFIPHQCPTGFDPSVGVPHHKPEGWIELGKSIDVSAVEGSYMFTVPSHAGGIIEGRGTLVMRPNTGNEVLRDVFQRMVEDPNQYPLKTGMLAMKLDEEAVIEPRPPYNSVGLMPEQARCVGYCALNPVTMIWGPPGTGKSVTLCGILSQALAQGLRVLILATANDALDSIAEKVYKQHLSGKDAVLSRLVEDGKITRYGSSPRIVNYPELAYKNRERIAKLRKEPPISVSASMEADTVTFATFFRFLHMPLNTYDMVLIDEVGFVNIPTIYAAAAIAKKKLVMCGDPRQNTPIFSYAPRDVGQTATTLFSRDIFRHNKLRIDPGQAPDARLCSLSTQYRMDDNIAAAVRLTNLYPRYESPETGRVVSKSETVALSCFPLPGVPLVLIDTGSLSPHAAENSNQTHIELIKLGVVSALQKTNIGSVGIVAPYKNQAKAYIKWVSDLRLGRTRAGTVHAFQGSEAPIVFFDTVEASTLSEKGGSHYFTDDVKYGQGTINNLNVAVSRAKGKLVIVADVGYVLQNLTRGCYLHRLFSHIAEKGHVVDAQVFLGQLGRRLGEKMNDSEYFDKKPDIVSAPNLFPVLAKDFSVARQNVNIMSRQFDRKFFLSFLEKIMPPCRNQGVSVNFFINHRATKEDRLFIAKAIDSVPFFSHSPPSDWKWGKSTFAVFDNRVYYQNTVDCETNIFKKTIPATTTRLVFETGLEATESSKH